MKKVAENSYKTDVTGGESTHPRVVKTASTRIFGDAVARGRECENIQGASDGIHGEPTERLSVPVSRSTCLVLMRHTAASILMYLRTASEYRLQRPRLLHCASDAYNFWYDKHILSERETYMYYVIPYARKIRPVRRPQYLCASSISRGITTNPLVGDTSIDETFVKVAITPAHGGQK